MPAHLGREKRKKIIDVTVTLWSSNLVTNHFGMSKYEPFTFVFQLSGLQYNLEYMQTSMIDKQQSARLEGKIRDLESRLELEQTARHRSEVSLFWFLFNS